MAERDRYGWDRERGRDDWDRDRGYGRGGDRERGYDERGMVERGTDEVRSWFGDDEARRRREADEFRDRQARPWEYAERDRYPDRDRQWGANSDAARREHGWSSQGGERDSSWDRNYRSGASGQGQTYGFGAPNWSGAPRTTGSGERGFESNRGYQGSDEPYRGGYGGYASGQSSPSFAGGYGAGNYTSTNYRGEDYSRYPGTTGEGRWGSNDRGSVGYGSSVPYGIGNFAGRGPRNYQRSDDRVREDVNERLTADPRVDASEIDVRVQNGEVTLSGTVDDRRTRRLAEEIIEDLPGVRDVRNELRVQKGWFSSGDDSRSDRDTRQDARDHDDGAIGKTGDPQKRDDVTTLNQTGKINR